MRNTLEQTQRVSVAEFVNGKCVGFAVAANGIRETIYSCTKGLTKPQQLRVYEEITSDLVGMIEAVTGEIGEDEEE